MEDFVNEENVDEVGAFDNENDDTDIKIVDNVNDVEDFDDADNVEIYERINGEEVVESVEKIEDSDDEIVRYIESRLDNGYWIVFPCQNLEELDQFTDNFLTNSQEDLVVHCCRIMFILLFKLFKLFRQNFLFHMYAKRAS